MLLCPHGAFDLGFLCDVALLVHVRTAHKLAREREALPLGTLQVHHQSVVGIREVRLVRVEDDGRLAVVVLSLKVQHDVVDGGLHVCLLGVDHQPYLQVESPQW